MLPLARLEGEPKSGAIFVYLFISATLKSVFLIEVEHKLQIDYQQTLRKTENDNRIPLITIPIDIGENTFTMLCSSPLNTAVQFNKVLSIIPPCYPTPNRL
jgi:hypothetical protein